MVFALQSSSELLECFIVSSVVKDCLVLPQYDLHHGTFLLVTPIVMSSYKRTIIQCKSTLPFGGVLYSVSFVPKVTKILLPIVLSDPVLAYSAPGR